MSHWFIYLLVDPRDDQVRYVGKTVDLAWRIEGHIQEGLDGGHTYKARWLKGLLDSGHVPEVRVVDEGDGESWAEAERFYIKFYRDEAGSPLTNMTDGGEGLSGWIHTPESREKMAVRRGVSLSEETKQKLREARYRQAPISDQGRQRIGEAARRNNTGKPRPDVVERNKKMAGFKWSDEQKSNLREVRRKQTNFNKKNWMSDLEPDLRSDLARQAALKRWEGK